MGLLSMAVLADSTGSALFARMASQYGESSAKLFQEWRELLKSVHTQPQQQQLVQVNDFFNQRILFDDDLNIWGKSDYWATPIETMGQQAGDCEDFSIAKYITLIKLGVSTAHLRLVYVKADVGLTQPQAHMVLAFYPTPSSEPYILDNLNKEVMPASQRPDLSPVFSFNSDGLWVGNNAQPKVKKPETRLSRWREVLIRMQADGLDQLPIN